MNARTRLRRLPEVLALVTSMLLVGSLGIVPATAGPASDLPEGISDPLHAPSAFGEMYLLERAGIDQGLRGAQRFSAASGAARSAAPPAAPGTDVLVNNPADDTPERTTQSETTLAVLGNTICAGYNNSGPGGFSGLSRSPDLGATWADLGGIGQRGDPVIAAHEATGTFYYAEIATIGGRPAIGVARSTDDCETFGAAVDASPASSPLMATSLNDKPWIAVDNTGGANDGDIYVCWTRFVSGGPSELRFSRSIDGGLTYVGEQVLAGGAGSATSPFGCSVAVGPNGDVNVAWADRAGATAGDIRFRRSLDGGVMFGPNTQVSTGNRHPGIDTQTNCNEGFLRPTLSGNIRMLHQAWLAVDATGGPFNGNLYVVWATDPVGTPDNSDVFFSRSTDGGTMWSAPVQVGAGGGATDQFEPFVAVGGAGAVSIAWYDRRNDQDNNLLIDVYKTFSADGGATLDPIIRVTDVNFPVPPILPNFDPGVVDCYMGEYIAIAADDTNFYYAWGDNRNTLFTTNFPGGRPDPDVFFDSQPAPAVVVDADLRLEKSDSPDPVVAGEQLVYTIDAFNDGPQTAFDVEVTDTLPAGVTYASDTGGCDTSALPILTCSLGTMLAGGTASFTITVNVPADFVFNAGGPTTITNTASISSTTNDPDLTNNTASEDTLVIAEADLEIVSFDAVNPPTELLVGDTADVTLQKVITNNGPSAPMDVELTLTATATAGGTVIPTLGVVAEPALGLNEERTVDEVFTVGCQAPGVHTFIFTNEIQPADPADGDPNQANNSAEERFAVACIVPVQINIKPGSDPNSINTRSKGNIPVAVLTTAAGEYGLPVAFDATTIDPLSVRFGPPALVNAGGGAPERHRRGHIQDAYELDETTKDGDLDMVLHFKTGRSGLSRGDTVACVRGLFMAPGGPFVFFGCDAVRIVK